MKQRVDRMSRLKEVAVGDHTEKDVKTAVAKISEVPFFAHGVPAPPTGRDIFFNGIKGYKRFYLVSSVWLFVFYLPME